jgi:threonine synthase
MACTGGKVATVEKGQAVIVTSYISTRGNDGPLGYEDTLLSGLARDGGLFIPSEWPKFSKQDFTALKGRPYTDIALAVISPFVGDDMPRDELKAMIEDTYRGFTHPECAPVFEISDNIHVCELFHGPTIAFKDYAMQFLSRAFDRALGVRGRRAVILGATSGDTGSAALEAFKGRDFIDIFILYPEGRTSPIQEKQMTGVIADGAFAIAVDGDFDACQDAVKTLFGDLDFRDRVGLSAVNSINWARLMPQIVYYVATALKLGAPERGVAFAVPTGNFGNIFAGYAARQMGLPIKTLICASNRNNILTRFFESGSMTRSSVEPSLSPSMDIQVSSNFERLLFEMLGRDADAVRGAMQHFTETGSFDVDAACLAEARTLFEAYSLDDDGTLAEIATTHERDGMILDPHSAVGVHAARKARADGVVDADTPIIALACASPAKFPDAVEAATGTHPELPPHLADLMEREERVLHVSGNPKDIAALIDEHKRQ